MNFEWTMKKKDVFRKPNDPVILSQVATGERIATVRLKSDGVRKFAKEHDLDIREMIPPEDVVLPEQYVVAMKRQVADVLAGKIDGCIIKFPALKEKITGVIDLVKEMRIADAVNFIGRYKRNKDKMMEESEVAVLEGLLFGYNPCDVEYYIKTRCMNFPEYENEQSDPIDEHLLCEKCSKRKA